MIRIIRNRIDGIAEPLPDGETVLWSARPDTFAFTWRQCRLGWVAAWFAGLALWRGWEAVQQGASLLQAAAHAAGLLPLAAGALGLLSLLGVAMARSTTYALTRRRLVMNTGTALPVTFNVPLRYIDRAELRDRGAHCDLLLALTPGVRPKLMALWPHVRSWRDSCVRPMLRDVPAAELKALLPLLVEVLRAEEAAAAGASPPASAVLPSAGAAPANGAAGSRPSSLPLPGRELLA